MINKEGLQTVIQNHMFHLMDIYGVDLPYSEVIRHLEDDDIFVDDEQMLKDAFDFVHDQAGENYAVSPVTQEVLKILADRSSNHGTIGNETPEAIRDEVFQMLMLQGQVDERTADSISQAVRSMMFDLMDGVKSYK